jgi:valyl-tRNA synthetase
MRKELGKTYEPKQVEDKIYKMWQDSGYFNPDNLPDRPGPKRNKKPFTIIMPPPNANGSLHIGHALFVTLEDIMIRYQRMQGRKTLWLPGADHAGFETQVVYTKKLEKEGRSFWEMPREQLYEL